MMYRDFKDVNKITDNKTFSVNMESLYPRKRKLANQITVEDSEENIISDDTLVSETLKKFFFKNATKWSINGKWYIVDSSSSITDPVDKEVKTYKNHSTILLMKQKLENMSYFSFKEVFKSEIEKDFRETNSYEVTTFDNIPTKILN